jgi:predicted DNA-binding transcriptional regulator AlpA
MAMGEVYARCFSEDLTAPLRGSGHFSASFPPLFRQLSASYPPLARMRQATTLLDDEADRLPETHSEGAPMPHTDTAMSAESQRASSETCSVEVAAARLGLSRSKAYELARQDALPVPVLRLGRKIVIPRRALDRVLLADEPAPTPPVAQVA